MGLRAGQNAPQTLPIHFNLPCSLRRGIIAVFCAPRGTHMAFSLRTLFTAVTVVAFFALALLYANEHWTIVTTTIVVVLLLIAILGAMHCAPPRRTFWNGFAIVAGAYFFLVPGRINFIQQPFLLTRTA